MIARALHLHDERLFGSYLAERAGEAIDPPVADHLADCADCSARYAELVRFLDDLRADGDAEADAVFTPERLRAQEQHIARRLEAIGRPARVISFPGRMAGPHMRVSSARGVARWIYSAAAAGLVIGVGLGAFYEAEWRMMSQRRQTSVIARQRDTRPTSVATAGINPATEASDDAFLSELDVALDHPRTRELQPFDALTPHVRER